MSTYVLEEFLNILVLLLVQRYAKFLTNPNGLLEKLERKIFLVIFFLILFFFFIFFFLKVGIIYQR